MIAADATLGVPADKSGRAIICVCPIAEDAKVGLLVVIATAVIGTTDCAGGEPTDAAPVVMSDPASWWSWLIAVLSTMAEYVSKLDVTNVSSSLIGRLSTSGAPVAKPEPLN